MGRDPSANTQPASSTGSFIFNTKALLAEHGHAAKRLHLKSQIINSLTHSPLSLSEEFALWPQINVLG